jgi:hypothetical protein
MRKDATAALAATAIACLSTGLWAGEPDYLGAEEVRALILGRTVEVRDETGAVARVYFSADGRRLALQGNEEYALPWRILPDGTHCVTDTAEDNCARIIRNGDGTYTRHRDGAPSYRWMKFLPGKALAMAPQASGTYTRATGPDQYEILVSEAGLTEPQARKQVAAVAESLCKTLVPVLGAFRFESTEFVPDSGAPGPRSFQFRQQVSCVPGVKAAPVERLPVLRTAEESRRIEQEVRAMTVAYFGNLVSGRLDEAYAKLDANALGTDKESWQADTVAFKAMAGEPLKLTILKMTVYDNPKDAPQPGLYVAADFSNEYRNVPFQCGYLMWFRPIGGEFRITRTETGHITADEVRTIPAARLAEIKRRLRCTL